MSDGRDEQLASRHPSRVDALASMLDYAMLEGAEMRLPLFVTLVRLARLVLTDSVEEDEQCPPIPRQNLEP
jgi:hypothetical protein